MKRRWLLAGLGLILVVGLGVGVGRFWPAPQPEDVTLDNGARLSWVSCWFDVPAGLDVDCARLEPAYRPWVVPGQRVSLPVVVIRAPSTLPKGGPVLHITGGPGYGTGLDSARIGYWLGRARTLDWPHDIVLFDQRGTGRSRPRVECPAILSETRALIDEPLTPGETYRRIAPVVRGCRDRLQGAGVDLGALSTRANARDALDLMAALGGERWNVYGTSYGTRVAMTVAHLRPGLIRSLLLDSVYPPEVDGTAQTPFIVANALDTLVSGCGRDAGCHAAFPALDGELEALLERLAEEPVQVEVTVPGEGAIEMAVNDYILVETIIQSLYLWQLLEVLPADLHAAYGADYAALRPHLQNYAMALLDPAYHDPVALSVECADRHRGLDAAAYAERVARYPQVARFVAEAWKYDLCELWPVPPTGPVVPEAAPPSDIPALILAGAYDPVTPSRWARETAERFTRAAVVEIEGIGHGAIESDECAARVARRFLRHPLRDPRTRCLDESEGPDFDTK